MKISIKDLVCPCCKKSAKKEIEKIGFPVNAINSIEIDIDDIIAEDTMILLKQAIMPFGLEIVGDRKTRLVERIKTLIIDLVNSSDEELKINLSEHIRTNINYNYNYTNKVFKEKTGTTIEKYFIIMKIERVKQLLRSDAESLSEIAYKMQYSSLAHLSNQFKKVTGTRPSYFKQFIDKRLEILASA